MATHFSIVYISPNGSTGKVAETLADQLAKGGAAVNLTDLSVAGAGRTLTHSSKVDEQTCLLIGSPVYRDMAVPPVMAFIDELPQSDGGWAVPFVTYGRACSGVALWQMALALMDKGFRIAGAAKVVAVHSMMCRSNNPVGEGHPDADDLQQVCYLADKLLQQFATGTPVPLAPEVLDYHPTELASVFKAKIGQPWMIVPKTVDERVCTGCGICADNCPVAAIILNHVPAFGDTCFDCFSCIRLCPEDAIIPSVPMVSIEEMISERVKNINEQPLTRIFSV
jgi:ferredoxin/flavodoxin